MADPLGLTDNPIMKLLGSIAGKSSPKPAPASTPSRSVTPSMASKYANQKPYIAPGSNWGEGQKATKPAAKKATTVSKKKKAPATTPKIKPNDKHVKPGYPAPKKKK